MSPKNNGRNFYNKFGDEAVGSLLLPAVHACDKPTDNL